MNYRLVSLLIIAVLLAGAVWAEGKSRVNPQTFINRSDAVYYYPQSHGVTDLAVDIKVAQLANDQVAGSARITFCFLAPDRREVIISNLTEQQANVRAALLGLVAPLGEYVVPRTSAETFTGMKTSAMKVLRQLAGLPGMTYYQLIGTPDDAKSPMKEYRVLVDEQGLAHQVETEGQDGSVISARIMNTRIGNSWFITQISTRMMNKDNAQWEIATMKYGEVNGITLPQEIVVQHRDPFNRPIKEMPDFTFAFTNYHINDGAAAKLLPPPAPAAAPVPTETPASAGAPEAK